MSAEPAAGWRLVAPHVHHAGTVASWSCSTQEAAAWVSQSEHPFPAAAVTAWWEEAGVDPWLLIDPDGSPVGYGELWDDEEEDEVELARLIVDPDRRHQGVGRRLVDELVARARSTGRGACFLRVVPDNVPALALYRSAGFREVDPAEANAWNSQQPIAYVWLQHPSFGAGHTT